MWMHRFGALIQDHAPCECEPARSSRGRYSGTLAPTEGPPMINAELFEQLQRRLSEVLAQSPAKDVEANLKAMLNAFFARLDLVTREEFDVQVAVLRRTREKLEAIEAKLAALEQGDRASDAEGVQNT